uniref:Serine carboxypeptidase S28 n=1 Tax=Panagrolaimus sp. JU765 TaxID=591449 RepID=A0AC34Q0L5_9BILA
MALLHIFLVALVFVTGFEAGRSPRPRHLPRYTFGRHFHGLLSRIEDAAADCDGGSYQEGFITQPVDHFDDSNKKTWNEYYQFNLNFYDASSSDLVFFMLGGESPISAKWVCKESYAYLQWAKKYKAAVFQAEHRYFGKSRPFSSQTVENLAYFTPEQILADYNNFISQMNRIHFNGKAMRWVLFGGSYPGSLTAWMRAAYPNASIGGVSSSSAVNLQVDYYGYATNMQKNYQGYNANCGANLEAAFKKIQTMSFSEDGRKQLAKTFNLCDDFPSADMITAKDLQFFWSNIFGEFQGINQYSGDNRDPLTADMGLGVPGACAIMNNLTEANVVQRVANVINWVNNLYGEPGVCMPNKYSDYIATYASPFYDASGDIASGRSWMWQCCTYLGYFQTTDGGHDNEIWGSLIPLDFYVDQCIELFNSTYNADYTFAQVEKYRKVFGAAKNYPGTKVVFPNGSLDPWFSLGLLQGDNVVGNEVFATTIQNGAHCSDMYPPRDQDSESLKSARQLIASKLDSFIQFSKRNVHAKVDK